MSDDLYPQEPILLVDDEPMFLRSLQVTLDTQGRINNTICCNDSREVLELIEKKRFSLVVLDLTMPFVSGEELLVVLAERAPEIPVIIFTGREEIDLAVRCIKKGAVDYFVKTDDMQRLVVRIKQIISATEIQQNFIDLKSHILATELKTPDAFHEIITQNRQMQNIFHYIEATAVSSEPILIRGENGTGKELIAKAIHHVSRPSQDYVSINVAGLDDSVFSDTLFGHVRGGFTSAETARPGMIETAKGGTLFLDEIGDLSQSSQTKLLRLIQEREFFPLGSDTKKQCHARFVFSTNANLEEKIAAGEFRKDLYFRLQTHQIILPPLRDRKEDLPPLVDYFIRLAAAEFGKNPPTPPAELFQLLGAYAFPGNVRELRGMVYNAVSVHEKGTMSMRAFKESIKLGVKGTDVVRDDKNLDTHSYFPTKLPTLKEVTEQLIEEALQRSQGNLSVAADTLGITRQALGQRLKRKQQKSSH